MTGNKSTSFEVGRQSEFGVGTKQEKQAGMDESFSFEVGTQDELGVGSDSAKYSELGQREVPGTSRGQEEVLCSTSIKYCTVSSRWSK